MAACQDSDEDSGGAGGPERPSRFTTGRAAGQDIVPQQHRQGLSRGVLEPQNKLAKQPIVRSQTNDFFEMKMLAPALRATVFDNGVRANTGGAARTSRIGIVRQHCSTWRTKPCFLRIERPAAGATDGRKDQLKEAIRQLAPGLGGHG